MLTKFKTNAAIFVKIHTNKAIKNSLMNDEQNKTKKEKKERKKKIKSRNTERTNKNNRR